MQIQGFIFLTNHHYLWIDVIILKGIILPSTSPFLPAIYSAWDWKRCFPHSESTSPCRTTGCPGVKTGGSDVQKLVCHADLRRYMERRSRATRTITADTRKLVNPRHSPGQLDGNMLYARNMLC